jgi:hypothetical protein
LTVARKMSFEEELSAEYDPHEHKPDLEKGIPEAHGIHKAFSLIKF